MGNIINVLTKYGLHRLIPGRKRLYGMYVKRKLKGHYTIDLQGFKMAISPTEKEYSFLEAFYSYYSNRIHEASTTELFKYVIYLGDTVIDIGANMGYFTLLSAKLVGKNGTVLSFEPEVKNYNYLKNNIEINGFKNVGAYNKAVSNESGKALLFVCPYDSGHGTLNQSDGITKYRETKGEIKSYEVKTTTLDDIIKNGVDVVKMDCEGSELLALEGMTKILKNNYNIKLFIEFFPLLIKSMGCNPREMIELLQENGFEIFIIPEYSMVGKKIININDYIDLMKYCPEKDSHLNLYCQRLKKYV